MTIKLTDDANSAFLYQLNSNGSNAWYAQIRPGLDDNNVRTTKQELHRVALKMAASEVMYDALLAVAKELLHSDGKVTQQSTAFDLVLAALDQAKGAAE